MELSKTTECCRSARTRTNFSPPDPVLGIFECTYPCGPKLAEPNVRYRIMTSGRCTTVMSANFVLGGKQLPQGGKFLPPPRVGCTAASLVPGKTVRISLVLTPVDVQTAGWPTSAGHLEE